MTTIHFTLVHAYLCSPYGKELNGIYSTPKKVSVYSRFYTIIFMSLKGHGHILSYIPDVKHVAKYSHIAQLCVRNMDIGKTN